MAEALGVKLMEIITIILALVGLFIISEDSSGRGQMLLDTLQLLEARANFIAIKITLESDDDRRYDLLVRRDELEREIMQVKRLLGLPTVQQTFFDDL
ncbi:hypothetical protein THIOM_005039 [Candidatus Thiomargarita nelsonii]|uniref:Uncharacterized protein n=1 Tax=Candidatus Thiomargarita nelsonii TaxID=1003181 RepID=A0A176RU90_9GAMM|nr:hypothetical protein THIOM_005039 [Candidatus Thiomargarita nelsonii]